MSILPYQPPSFNDGFPIGPAPLLPALLVSRQPSSSGPLSTSTESDTAGHFNLAGKRVVIVEDEGITQVQLRRIFRLAGLEVVGVASNGEAAIKIVLETKPDLVLMDIQMPVMNGIEASRRIMEQYRVCIVMLTAFSDEEYQQEASAIGVCGYVIKPIVASILLPKLVEAFEKFSPN